MKLKIVIGLFLVLVLGIGIAAVKALQIKAMIGAKAMFAPPPETITSAVVGEDAWPEVLPAVGTVNPKDGVTLMVEIAGRLQEKEFESGAKVAAGDLIVKLDTSSEVAQLDAAVAQSELAKITAERLRRLRADKTVAQSELDQAEANLKQDDASVENLRAIIAKKNLRAPFAGRLGIWQANVGQFLDSGKALISLISLSPLFVDFSLPQQEIAQLTNGLKVQATADAYPGRVFEGTVTAINPDLNAVTRSVQLRAQFENADELLRPGMFVRVAVVLPQVQPVLTVPVPAILSAPYGDAVYVITPQTENGKTNLIVQQKLVRTGRARGDFVSVESGLQAGDHVVTSGLFKLHNGSSVQENNAPADSPQPSLTPTPPNS